MAALPMEPVHFPGPDRAPAPPSPDQNDSHASDACGELIARLGARARPYERYGTGHLVAEGSMGWVFQTSDADLHRELAMKVMKPVAARQGGSPRSPRSSQQVARFVEEAQITGQLDHPGIVPVHEIGLDPEGRLYFTMKLVRGTTLRQVIELAWKEQDDWSTTRVLGLLLKVCDALGYAHERRVIHRDLKPANVMVGRFGEVYVMDWGLARLLDRADTNGARPGPADDDPGTVLYSGRHDGTPATPDSPLATVDGDVLGTPAYMSPEQASGALDRIGIQTDVYAVGAILYHLLARRMPYCEPGVPIDNHAVWRRVRKGPPLRLEELAPKTPPELVAICEKAMARDPSLRYATASELGDDLRAYLENRVVRAHRTGAIVELRKWVRRNRTAAASIGAAILLGVAGIGAIAIQERTRARQLLLSADVALGERLLGDLATLSPADPSGAQAMEAWLEQARGLLERAPEHERRLQQLVEEARSRGIVQDVDYLPPADVAKKIEFGHAKAEAFRALLETKRALIAAGSASAADLADARLCAEILPREIDAWERCARKQESSRTTVPHLLDPRLETLNQSWMRLLDDVAKLRTRGIGELEARLEAARGLTRRTIEDEHAAWTRACESIRDPARCPAYGGLVLAPQRGLVPLGQDPASGLWEFWHVLSGERPEKAPGGGWTIGPATGIVLVLIPGGRVHVGADNRDSDAWHYDPAATSTEKPGEIELDPYFLSKYETTQGQWALATGENPSGFLAGEGYGDDPRITRSHPVETVSAADCDETLHQLGLELPTEAQWERAARAGARTPYPCGTDPDCLRGIVNAYDHSLWAQPGKQQQSTPDPSFSDGHALHAEVGSHPPNGFGLHDMLGNVREWCRDWYTDSCDTAPMRPRDGLRSPKTAKMRVMRGGSCYDPLDALRFSARAPQPPSITHQSVGVRASRSLDP